MEEKENIRLVVKSNLRSVTQSCKGGVPFDRLESDYKALLGTPIPYRNLGFRSLQDLIESMPDVIRIVRNKGRQPMVEGVADETTEHIAKMVSKQRDVRTRKPVHRYGPQSRSYRMPSRGLPSKYSNTPSSRRYPVQQQRSTRSASFNSLSSTAPPPRKSISPSSKPSQLRTFNQKSPTKQAFVSNKTSFEVPPRFQRQQESSQYVKSSMTALDYGQPSEESPVTTRTNAKPESMRPPRLKPANMPAEEGRALIKPLIEPLAPIVFASNILPPCDTAKKIPSPKPKPVSSSRRPLPPPPLPIAHLSAKSFIEEYAATHGLEYSYQTKTIGQKKKNYISVLILSGKKFQSSFPDEKPTQAQAEEVAASKARAEIEQKAKETIYEVTPHGTVQEIAALMSRIEEMVAEKPNGVFNSHCEDVYKMKFQQKLPDVWLSYVKEHLSGTVEVENLDHLNSPKDSCILRIYKAPSGTTTPTSTSSRLSNTLEEDVNELNPSVANVSLHGVPDLCMPDKPLCDVFVTCIANLPLISVRILDNEDYFYEFCNNMSAFYQARAFPSQEVIVNKLYLVRDEQENYQRVLVEEIQADINKVLCYFVDIGETTLLNLADLQELDATFASLPHQAVNLSLSGVEEYLQLIKEESLCGHLLGKSLVAEIISRDENGISAVLYDTSEAFDVNINDVLKDEALNNALEFEMPLQGSTIICFVTFVTPDGDVFLRIKKPNVSLLEEELEKLSPKFELQVTQPTPVFSVEKMYVAKFIDELWYRAKLMGPVDPNATEVEVFYVDYGNTSFVPLNSICDLEYFSPILANVPFQAVPCMLSEIPLNWRWSEDVVKKFYELVPENETLIVKVDQPANENLPTLVSLYIRNEDSAIVSINQTLRFSKELFREEAIPQASASSGRPDTLTSDSGLLSRYIPDVAVPAEVHMAKRHTFDPSPYQHIWAPTPEGDNEPLIVQRDTVPSAVIPKIGEYFDVYIPWVANPWNFVVQPLSTSKELKLLESKMLMFYSSEDNVCELPLCVLKLDQVYAVLHSDKVWYRARLKQIIQEEPVMATVHFVDYGDFSTVETPNIQTLYSEFMSLPCQAIKASLTGVRPYSEDWEPEQCLSFHKLISEKSMVSVIVKKHRSDERDFGFSLIELALIDTKDPSEDVLIHEELIKKKLALAV